MTTSTTSSSQVALSSDINQTQLTNHIPEILKRAAEAKNLGDKRAIFEGVYSEIQQISQKRALEAPLASAFLHFFTTTPHKRCMGKLKEMLQRAGIIFVATRGMKSQLNLPKKQ